MEAGCSIYSIFLGGLLSWNLMAVGRFRILTGQGSPEPERPLCNYTEKGR
jgi:hypothetical protein